MLAGRTNRILTGIRWNGDSFGRQHEIMIHSLVSPWLASAGKAGSTAGQHC